MTSSVMRWRHYGPPTSSTCNASSSGTTAGTKPFVCSTHSPVCITDYTLRSSITLALNYLSHCCSIACDTKNHPRRVDHAVCHVCLSVTSPATTILNQFWWSFVPCIVLSPKSKIVFIRGQNPTIPSLLSLVFYPRNGFSMAMSENHTNETFDRLCHVAFDSSKDASCRLGMVKLMHKHASKNKRLGLLDRYHNVRINPSLYLASYLYNENNGWANTSFSSLHIFVARPY